MVKTPHRKTQMKLTFSLIFIALTLSHCKTAAPTSIAKSEQVPAEQSKPGMVRCGDGEQLVHTNVRIVAANISSGNRQNYDGGEGKRILMGLKPDIVLMQEFNYKSKSPADYQEFADAVIGSDANQDAMSPKAYVAVDKAPNHSIPNGIVSRFPILSSGDWIDTQINDRDFAWARIDLPGAHELFAISVHLKASSDGKSQNRRINQAKLLMQNIAKEVSANDYAVIGGDFNTVSRSEQSVAIFTGLTPVADLENPRLFSDKHVPVSYQANNATPMSGTNANRKNNYDWVLPDTNLDELHAPVVLGNGGEKQLGVNFFPEGLVVDTRTFLDLSAIAPAQVGDSAAVNMQHMAVVRDFAIPHCLPIATMPMPTPNPEP